MSGGSSGRGDVGLAPSAGEGPADGARASNGDPPPEVRLERHGARVAVVVLDRPERRNALGWDTWPQLEAAVATAERDPGIGAIVLTGQGGGFSAGGDLKSLGPRGAGVLAPGARIALAHRAVLALHRCAKPTVAAVEGFAVGAGWSLVLACDLVVAAEDAFFAAPFLRRGLVPDVGIGWLLPRCIGRHRANELLLLAERLGAPRASELGLVNRLVAPGGALDGAVELAQRLADGPPDAQALTKRLVLAGASEPLEAYLADEVLAVSLTGHGAEVAEGRAAFLERREPSFHRRADVAD